MEHRRAVRHRGGGQQCGHIGRGPAAVERRLDRARRQRPAGTDRRERFRWIEADLLQLAAVAQISQTAEPARRHYLRGRGPAHRAAQGLDHGFGRQMWQLHVDGPTRRWTDWSRGWSTEVASW